MNDNIDDVLVFWSHNDKRYTVIVDHNALEDEARQLQLTIAKYMYLLEATCFNK